MHTKDFSEWKDALAVRLRALDILTSYNRNMYSGYSWMWWMPLSEYLRYEVVNALVDGVSELQSERGGSAFSSITHVPVLHMIETTIALCEQLECPTGGEL